MKRCPKCNSKLQRVHRNGWPTVWECGNMNERFICGWLDPIKFGGTWRALQQAEDLKAIREVKQDQISSFDELEAHIKSPNYLKQ